MAYKASNAVVNTKCSEPHFYGPKREIATTLQKNTCN